MTNRTSCLLAGAAGLAALALAVATPASALTSAECSALYKAAQQAKTLDGASWNDFQKSKCSVAPAATNTAAPAAAPAAVPAAATNAAVPAAAAAPAAVDKKIAQAPAATTKAPETKAATAPAATAPVAKGLTSKECSLKYKESKAANTLNGLKWKDFQKAQCGAGAAPPTGKVDTATAAATAAAGTATFPTALSPKYASEKPGRARMNTCLDQYRANKATGGNGGMTWISRKGGGYYSACNKKLKGQA